MASYVALIGRENGIYGIVFLDLPGCSAAGITIAGALTNASRVLWDWLKAAQETGVEIPVPRSIARLSEDTAVARALAAGATLASVHPSPSEEIAL